MSGSELPKYLYMGNDIPEVLKLYEADLRKNDDFKSLSHANAIKRYHDEITDKKFLAVIRKNFNSLYQILEKELPDLRFYMEGRRKSLISSEKKILKLLNENKSTDLFRDIFGFRITLFGNDSLELVKTCYKVMNKLITLYISNGYTLCEEDPVADTSDFDATQHPNIIIPSESYISPSYLYGVKDYILHPKVNGYQSLHVVFRTPTAHCFEIQVRTFDMNVHAVDGSAHHEVYKSIKYANPIDFDRKKIHISGYGLSPNGTLFDFIGLEKALIILSRQKTF